MAPEPSEHGTALVRWMEQRDYRDVHVAVALDCSHSTVRNLLTGRVQTPSRLLRKAMHDFCAKEQIDPPAGW